MCKKVFMNCLNVAILLGVCQLPTLAEGIGNEEIVAALNNMWILLAAFLIFFMQAGFALVESGYTRAKNAGNIIMKNLMDFSVGSLIYWCAGFSIMFGTTSVCGLFGMGPLFAGGGEATATTLMFQTVFCATAATIVSGAMAERTKFSAYLVYSAVISLVIYPVVGHWIWGGGWISKLGFIDFAGSTVVHSLGGWAALLGSIFLGPRIGKFRSDGKANAIPGHNLVLAALGVFILWFGWFGFNPGSTVSAFAPNLGLIALTTNLAAAAGACTAMITSWVKYGKPDVSMTLNGVLAGLVAITAGCANVSAGGAAIIGAIAGVLVIYAVELLDKLKIDDPVGAFPVHGVCGVTGTLMVGLFATDGGLFYGGGWHLLGIQAIGVLAVMAWGIATCSILFYTIKHTIGLRVSADEEVEGLDITEHSGYAYPDMFSAKVKI